MTRPEIVVLFVFAYVGLSIGSAILVRWAFRPTEAHGTIILPREAMPAPPSQPPRRLSADEVERKIKVVNDVLHIVRDTMKPLVARGDELLEAVRRILADPNSCGRSRQPVGELCWPATRGQTGPRRNRRGANREYSDVATVIDQFRKVFVDTTLTNFLQAYRDTITSFRPACLPMCVVASLEGPLGLRKRCSANLPAGGTGRNMPLLKCI